MKRDKALWWKVMYKQLCMWWKRDHLKLFAAQGQQSKLEDLPRGITYHTVSRHQRRRKLQIQGQRDEDSGGLRERTDKPGTQKDAQYQDPEEEADDAVNTYDAGDDASKNLDEQRRRFGVINLQHGPGTTVASPPEGDPTKTRRRHFKKEKRASCTKETKVSP